MFLLLSRAADLQCYDKITQSTQQRSALLRIEKYIDVRHATLDKSRAERGVHVYWQIAYNCSRIAQSETSENVLFGGKIFVDLGAREKLTLSLSHQAVTQIFYFIPFPYRAAFLLPLRSCCFFPSFCSFITGVLEKFPINTLTAVFLREKSAFLRPFFSRPPIFSYTRSCITNIISHAGFD